MQIPNQQSNGPNLTNQQWATLLGLLGQSPQANPTSPQFNPNFFSQLMNLSRQQENQQMSAPVTQPIVTKDTPSCNYIAVKLADDPSAIQPQEVTMGSRNLFPSSDGSKIFMKVWNNEGLIETDVYVKQPRASAQKQRKKPVDQGSDNDLSMRLSELEVAIRKIQKQLTQRPSRATKPKRNDSNEMAPPIESDRVSIVEDSLASDDNSSSDYDVYEEVSCNE